MIELDRLVRKGLSKGRSDRPGDKMVTRGLPRVQGTICERGRKSSRISMPSEKSQQVPSGPRTEGFLMQWEGRARGLSAPASGIAARLRMPLREDGHYDRQIRNSCTII